MAGGQRLAGRTFLPAIEQREAIFLDDAQAETPLAQHFQQIAVPRREEHRNDEDATRDDRHHSRYGSFHAAGGIAAEHSTDDTDKR